MAHPPAAAAAYVRACREASRQGGKASGKLISQRQALIQWALSEGLSFATFSVEGLQLIPPPGAEHTAYHCRLTNTVIKITHDGSFGWSAESEGKRATPLEYLDRLAWQNLLFSDEISIVAVVGEERVMRVVTRQPYIFEALDSPDITLEEIDQFFQERNFRKIALN